MFSDQCFPKMSTGSPSRHSHLRYFWPPLSVILQSPGHTRSESEFNTAFDNYIKAVPATPVISQAQVENTVRMVNLTEKTPLSATYDQVVSADLSREAAKDILGK